MVAHLPLVALIANITATAQTPIPRQGDSCPTGTYKSGDYCKPIKSNSDQLIIQKNGSDCPTGFYSAGNYCKRISSSDRQAIPREDDSKCPTGWQVRRVLCKAIMMPPSPHTHSNSTSDISKIFNNNQIFPANTYERRQLPMITDEYQ